MPGSLLQVENLTIRRDDGTGSAVLHDLSLKLDENEVLIVKGRSGSGKSTLLKCIAQLNVYEAGQTTLHGKPPSEYGIAHYRTKVLYIPQRPAILPGSPKDFLRTVSSFASRNTDAKKSNDENDSSVTPGFNQCFQRASDLARHWGIEPYLWTRDWSTLSGGEAQRVALALAIGLGGAEIVLLDEPTSALDEETMKTVEQSLINMLPNGRSPDPSLKAFIWITHEQAQADRVGTRTLHL